jgi:NADH-quinone oxidoreductase subunit L
MYPLLRVGSEVGHLSPAMIVMAVIGTFTAIFAATIALAQNDIKRVLAYSTISQLGYMVAALGIGAYVAVVFHLITHAFFKALLFLGSGSVIHGVEHGVLHSGEKVDPQNMFNMGGLRKKMPITFWTFLIGGLALSGFPIITAGFWSKDEILAEAFGSGHWVVFAVLSIAAFLTAFYTMRQITLTFLGKPRTESAQHAQETHWTMTLPLVFLAVFAVSIGWAGISRTFPVLGGILPNYVHDFIGGTLAEAPEILPFNIWPLVVSLVAALGGLSLGWLVYRNQNQGAEDPLKSILGPVYTVLQNKYYFDELYNTIFVRPAYWVADNFTNQILDRGIIDGILHFIARVASNVGHVFRNYFDKPVVNGFGDFVGEGIKKIGRSIKVVQTGKVQQYLLMALILAFGAMFYFVFRFIQH